MLSALQQRVASIVNHLPAAVDFALAGGGALIARGDVDRLTRDLDFFATRAEEVDRLLPILEAVLRSDGLDVERVSSSPGWARLLVRDSVERTEIDLAHDFRLLPIEDTAAGRTLALEELAIDKLLALFDRAEARGLRRPRRDRTALRPGASVLARSRQGRWLRRARPARAPRPRAVAPRRRVQP